MTDDTLNLLVVVFVFIGSLVIVLSGIGWLLWKVFKRWLCLVLALSCSALAQSQRGIENDLRASVQLAWDAPTNATPGLNYRVYYKRIGQDSVGSQDAGTNLSVRVFALERKTTYRFVVTAINKEGIESEPSNEVTYKTALSPSWR